MRRLYFHTGQLVTALGRSFVVWALSDAGQAVVAASEFHAVRLTTPGEITAAAPGLPEEYRNVAGSAVRLPTSLRFASGLDWLDARSRADLERIAALLRRPENARRKLVLVGFSQPDVKSPIEAEEKSRERAEQVAAQLRLLEAPVIQIRGFGGRLPLADPIQPNARWRNERIEVWLR
jgi:phosphate transport system substrate-binding protein